MKQSVWNREKASRFFEVAFLLVLMIYPLRHVTWGLDMWDTGYNYGNFRFLGEGYLDPMWFFSTYLANVTGHILTLLPFGGTLVGMNVYSGLLVSALAVMGYFFGVYTLKMPKPLVFVGELLAVSLCWCPTALLYNYLTYILFLGAVILIYKGLTGEKKGVLFVAGILLATNIFVRFSNLPEAGLILAVWGYDVLDSIERKEKPFTRMGKDTLACLGGYLSGLAVWLAWIAFRYGIRAYGNAISRLFSMTEGASDYTALSMLRGIVMPYLDMIYWVVRIGVFAAAGIMILCLAKSLSRRMERHGEKHFLSHPILWVGRLGFAGVMAGMIIWLYQRGFCSFLLYSYDAMLRPAILVMFFLLAVAVLRILMPGVGKDEKLLSALVILILLLTPIGSNNGLYPAINNWFVAAPYLLWQLYRFVQWAREKNRNAVGGILPFGLVPAAAALCVITVFCSVHFLAFGAGFQFAEATGIQDISYRVTGNPVLAGVGMSKEKAMLMQDLTNVVKEKNIGQKQIVLFGQIPSLAFYLDMKPAFNTWCDLDSFATSVMKEELEALSMRYQYDFAEGDYPVVITAKKEMNLENPKWQLMDSFLKELGYENVFENDTVVLWTMM